MKRSLWIWALLVPVLLFRGAPALDACTVLEVAKPEQAVRQAEVIVRVRAAGYSVPPGEREDDRGLGIVTFDVLEVLRGKGVPRSLELPGILTSFDDFNDREIPYDFVRPGGRHGNCWAYEYRHGAEFLLLLDRKDDGTYAVDWLPLAPINEQLRGPDDPWLWWVRGAVGAIGDSLLPKAYASFRRGAGLEVLVVSSNGKPLPGRVLSLCPLREGVALSEEIAARDGFLPTQLAPIGIDTTRNGRAPNTVVVLLNPVCFDC